MRLSPHPNGAGHFRGTPLSVLTPMTYVRPRSDLAHEHGTTRRRRSPAVPENKAFLLVALSDFSGLLWSVAFLAVLRRVHPITGWHLVTQLPPPSVLHAGILASRWRVKQFQSSPVPCGRVLATLSLPALRRVSGGRTLTEVETVRHTHTVTVWSSVSAAFTCLDLRRFSHRFLSEASVAGVGLVCVSAYRHWSIVSGLHTSRSAAPQRMPLTPRIVLQMGLSRLHVHPLKGALHHLQWQYHFPAQL